MRARARPGARLGSARASATTTRRRLPPPAATTIELTAIVGRRLGHRHAVAQAHLAAELADLPVVLPRVPGEVAIRVDRDRVPDRLEQRDVGDGVAVGVRLREVDAVARGQLADRGRLVRAVRVEGELAGVVAVGVELRPGGDGVVGAEVRARAAAPPRRVTTTRSRPCDRSPCARRSARRPRRR